jgi:predicted acylesterase/phospholipase RssA
MFSNSLTAIPANGLLSGISSVDGNVSVRSFVAALCILSMLVGCATLPRNPVPADKVFEAEITGMPGIRAWGGILSEDFQADLIASREQESPGQFLSDENGWPLYDGLALSGGGATGAFGAGFLYGWTQTGKRPNFKMVSGISTGALIAPLAFLGQDYDEQLKTVFTSVDSENIMERLSLFSLLFRSESLASTGPLKKLIEKNFDATFIEKVAARHNHGYRLYIGTYHMDAQRLVVWNMGLIANSQHPDAPDLFRNVVLASASIPIAFPPVYIESEVEGVTYDEMHADGGVSVQVFFYAGTVDIKSAVESLQDFKNEPAPKRSGDLYIIRNGQLSSTPTQVKRKLSDITGRAVDSMIKHSAVGDLFRIHEFAERDGIGFKYVAVPPDYIPDSDEPFDRAEMRRLFDIGHELGETGTAWKSTPPGMSSAASAN